MNLYHNLMQRSEDGKPIRIGLIGAGKFGSMFLAQARKTPGFQIIGVADLKLSTAHKTLTTLGWDHEQIVVQTTSARINDSAQLNKLSLTENTSALIESNLDVLIESTGNPEAGAAHAKAAIEAGHHVIMVTVESDALIGPVLSKQAKDAGVVYSMAYGDQPALICELVDWARISGFEVVAAGKGTKFLPEYHFSTPDTVWDYYGLSSSQAKQDHLNAKMFNSFIDGTKSAIEMAAVANATGLGVSEHGLRFPPVRIDELASVLKPAEHGGILSEPGIVEVISSVKRDGNPVPQNLRWGVYVTFKSSDPYTQQCFKQYGCHTDSSGEYAALSRSHHLVGLELGVSVASAVLLNQPTGTSKNFVADVVACAKRNLKAHETLDGEGGYTIFGKLMTAKESLQHAALPIGLASGAILKTDKSQGELIRYSDVTVHSDPVLFHLRKQLEETLTGKP